MDLTVLASANKWSTLLFVDAVDICALVNEVSCYIHVTVNTSDGERRIAVIVFTIYFSLGLN